MENTILIRPVDEEMALIANAVLILNNYKTAGFLKREAFVEIIMDVEKKYHNPEGMKLLNNFWACRVKDEKLNNDLDVIFQQLKSK